MVSKAGTRLCDGCLYGGEYVGLAFATPVLFWVLTAFDWRAVFISSGVLGLVFSVFWFKMYHEPNRYRKVNREELDYIREGGGLTEVSESAGRITWRDFVQLLKYRKLVGLYIGQFAVASTLFFF